MERESGGQVVFAHEFFSSRHWRERRPLSRLEAFVDLARCASVSPSGVFRASERALRDRWAWKSCGKVRRFIAILRHVELLTAGSRPSELSLMPRDQPDQRIAITPREIALFGLDSSAARMLETARREGHIIALPGRSGWWMFGLPLPEEWPTIGWPALRRGRRIPIPTTIRERVLGAAVCARCGDSASLQVDHIIPISRGGSHHPGNLQCLCRGCNGRKGASLHA